MINPYALMPPPFFSSWKKNSVGIGVKKKGLKRKKENGFYKAKSPFN